MLHPNSRQITRSIIHFILYFIITFTMTQNGFAYAPEIKDAVAAIANSAEIPPTDRQKAIAFKHNQTINIMRLNGHISEGIYLKNQAFFDKLNENFSQQAADKNGVKLEKQKKKAGEKPKAGTDTDNILSRGDSGQPITTKQAKGTRQSYNKIVGDWLEKMGEGDATPVDYAKETDTDFLVSRSAVDSDAAFKAISDYINSQGGTAYTRGSAANAEYKIRINGGDPPPKVPEVFSFTEAQGYVEEMHELSRHKFDDATIWDKKFIDLQKQNPQKGTQAHNDMEIARGMSHLARAQASKYITRINKINFQIANQFKVAYTQLNSKGFKALSTGGERDPGKKIREDSDTVLGSEGSAMETAALEKQLMFKATENFVDTLIAVAEKNRDSTDVKDSVIKSIAAVYKEFSAKDRGLVIEKAKTIVGDGFAAALATRFRGESKPVLSPETIKTRKTANDMLNELVKKNGGRKLAAAMVIDQVKNTIDTLDNTLDWLDTKLLGELRKEPAFHDFESEAKKVKPTETKTKRKKLIHNIKTNKAVGSIQKLNHKLNTMVQSSATGRGVTGALGAYNLATELPVYWKAISKGDWNTLGTELFRRRVPFGGAVENIAMENYLLAGWDCVTTVIPPLGLPQAIAGITLQSLKAGENYYWNQGLRSFKNQLFMTADFKIMDVVSHEGIKTANWELVSVRYTDTTREKQSAIYRKTLEEQGNIIKKEALRQWIDESWHMDDLLYKTIYSADPVLNALKQMMAHPAITDKGKQHLYGKKSAKGKDAVNWEMPGVFERESHLKDWFTVSLIRELETRMAAEYAMVTGNYEIHFNSLLSVARELDIEKEIAAAVSLETKSTVLNWLWDKSNLLLLEGGTLTKELEDVSALILKYLTAYENILSSRGRIEKEAGIKGVSAAGLRILTGAAMLTGEPDTDLKTAKQWEKEPGKAKSKMYNTLTAIKEKYIKNSTLDSRFDKDILDKASAHETWRRAWRFVYMTRDKLKSKALEQAKLEKNKVEKQTLLFEAHYKGMTTLLRLRVYRQLDTEKTKIPIENAVLRLKTIDAAMDVEKQLLAGAEPGEWEINILPGKYRITASAKGFKAADGRTETMVDIFIPVPALKNSSPVKKKMFLSPIKGEMAVIVKDKTSGQPVRDASVILTAGSNKTIKPGIEKKDTGQYTFKGLFPDTDYALKVSAPYYQGPVLKTGLRIDPGVSPSRADEVSISLVPVLSSIKVTAVDQKGGQPLKGVRIELKEKMAVTNSNGVVQFDDVMPSIKEDYQVQAEKKGYAAMHQNVTVLPDLENSIFQVNFVMQPGGKISVTVMDEESGAPIPEAEIRVTGYPDYDEQKLGSQNGEAVFTHLALEEHYIQVSKEGYLSPERDVTARISANNLEHNIIIKMATGIKVKVLLRDKKTQAYVVGRVSLDGGIDKFAPSGSFEFARVTTDKAHTFNVSADCYEQATKTIVFSPSPDHQTLEFALNPARSLRVEARDGAALIKGTSQIAINGPGLSDKGQGTSKLFGGLTAGSYTATIMAEGYSKGTGSITINPDDKRCAYTLMVQMKKLLANLSVSAVLYGKLEEGEPVPQVNISVSGPTSYSAIGRFAMVKGLPKGSYKITASAKGYRTASTTIKIDPTVVGQSYSTVINLNKTAVVQEQPPTADEIKKLIKEGKIDQANTLLDTMEDGGEKIFASLPDDLKEKLLNPKEEEEPDVIEVDSENIEDEIKKLIAEGKTEKANELLDKMDDGGEKIFAELPPDLKDKLLNPPEEKVPGKVKERDEATGEQIKKLIAEGKTEKANELLDKMADGGEKVFAELPAELKDKLLSPPGDDSSGEKSQPEVLSDLEKKIQKISSSGSEIQPGLEKDLETWKKKKREEQKGPVLSQQPGTADSPGKRPGSPPGVTVGTEKMEGAIVRVVQKKQELEKKIRQMIKKAEPQKKKAAAVKEKIQDKNKGLVKLIGKVKSTKEKKSAMAIMKEAQAKAKNEYKKKKPKFGVEFRKFDNGKGIRAIWMTMEIDLKPPVAGRKRWKYEHGPQVWFHENGNVDWFEYRVEGTKEGPCFRFRENGELNEFENFNKGELHGEIFRYHSGGKDISSMTTYVNGIKQGDYLSWHANGRPAAIMGYKNGKQHGDQISWDKNGTTMIIRHFVDGKETGLHYSQRQWNDGVIYTRTWPYSNGKENGLCTDKLTASGTIIRQGVFEAKNGKLTGTVALEYAHGGLYAYGRTRPGYWVERTHDYETISPSNRCGKWKMRNTKIENGKTVLAGGWDDSQHRSCK